MVTIITLAVSNTIVLVYHAKSFFFYCIKLYCKRVYVGQMDRCQNIILIRLGEPTGDDSNVDVYRFSCSPRSVDTNPVLVIPSCSSSIEI